MKLRGISAFGPPATLAIALAAALATPAARAQAEPGVDEPARTEETAAAEPDAGSGPIGRADLLWARRAEGSSGGRAAAQPIGEIVEIYSEALEADPDDLVLRGKLLRALFYLGEYATNDRETKLEIFTRGQEIGEAGLEQLAAGVGSRDALDRLSPDEIGARFATTPGAADVYYWTGVQWGLWGRVRGPIAAAKQGVAAKIRDYAERTIALDPQLENAGGHRLRGQLHAEAPKIPIFTGWIDRKLALRELERAAELFPQDLLTRFYLAKALHEHDRASRPRALELLRSVVASSPNPGWLVEERVVIVDARKLLAELSR